MSKWPAAVIFDFDGVIVNSEPLHFQAFQEVAADEKIELTENEYYSELIGFDDKGAWKFLFAKHKRELDPKTFLRVMTRKSEVMRDLIARRQYKALPGAEECIRGLWRKYPLAICSGALREEIETMLEGVSLRDCFGVIVAAEDVTVGKPDPSGYLMATRLLSEKIKQILTPADCLIVEDAPKVASSVKKVGFPVLALTSSHSADKFTDADWIVDSLSPKVLHTAVPALKFLI
ncbi:MAG TPA: HAD family phosphatase [Tepidisphaeraceae bacterium]|nr:HAD family phosphatase [Tepidisphaeraceae bacterium]